MSNPINVVGQDSFKTEVLESLTPVLVDFWASWCGPCQMMVPILEEMASELGSKLKIVKIDTEDPANQQLARDYEIQSIPNMKLFDQGKMIKDFIGYRPKNVFMAELRDFLN